ncbi:unnamed protein product [Taenia asiatica]|uniref:SCP domain-containing protein n=1 Tax=Taenia asiatica TaxID=60517 RepID=A0A0R3VXV1_TAEAS|nr:unnamed protein product [Taenia asiatica]
MLEMKLPNTLVALLIVLRVVVWANARSNPMLTATHLVEEREDLGGDEDSGGYNIDYDGADEEDDVVAVGAGGTYCKHEQNNGEKEPDFGELVEQAWEKLRNPSAGDIASPTVAIGCFQLTQGCGAMALAAVGWDG